MARVRLLTSLKNELPRIGVGEICPERDLRRPVLRRLKWRVVYLDALFCSNKDARLIGAVAALARIDERVGLRQSDDEGDRRNPPHIERRIIDLDLDERCFVRISVWLCAAG